MKYFVHGLTLLFLVFKGFACSGSASRLAVENLVEPHQETRLQGTVEFAPSASIDSLVVFGDSLSDTGRLRTRTLVFYPPNAYWHSRASNGPLWIDFVQSALGWRTRNQAVAGAATNDDSWFKSFFIDSLQEQIEDYIADTRKLDQSRTLAVLWIGPNNYLGRPGNEDVRQSMADIQSAVEALHRRGLKYFMIGTMPQLGGLPAFQNSPNQDRRLRRVTEAHNARLKTLLESLRNRHRGARISVFQAYDINQQTVDHPSEFGFQNLTEACYQGDPLGRFPGDERFCQTPSAHKFWDDVHPNSKMHCYYAAQFLGDLQTSGLVQSYRRSEAIDRCRRL